MAGLLCPKCRGRGFCGKKYCDLAPRIKSVKMLASSIGDGLSGSSPPAVFVGRHGYPRVRVGVLAPPVHGNTSIYDSPRDWFSKRMGIGQVFDLRTRLVNSHFSSPVRGRMPRMIEVLQEVAMSSRPLGVEAEYKKPVRATLELSRFFAPVGPSGEIDRLRVDSNPRVPRPVEKTVYDTDLKASEAVLYLYKKGVDENRTTKLLSIGLLGLGKNRRLVPTRWSITAVDDTIGKKLLENVRRNEPIEEYRVYHSFHLGNRFVVVLLPGAWSFEVIEASLPGTAWTPQAREPVFYQDWEPYEGRKTYAENVTGGYYAERLAVLEALEREGTQARTLVLREVTSEYSVPLGVWVVRETMREAMRSTPERFETLEGALDRAFSLLSIPRREWEARSWLLREHKSQTRLSLFARKNNLT